MKRMGYFCISKELFDNNFELVKQIFKHLEFVPINISHYDKLDQTCYIGYSPLFREADEGEIIPSYRIYFIAESENKYKIEISEIV